MRHSKGNPSLCYFLAVVIFLNSTRAEPAVAWISPSSGDLFGPGDIIIAKWSAAKADSPVFKLCSSKEGLVRDNRNDSNDNCGLAVPALVEKIAGLYLASLAVPNVTSEGGFYLAMEDDFATTFSPAFSLISSTVNTENGPPSVPVNPLSQQSSYPSSSSSSTSNSHSSIPKLPLTSPTPPSTAISASTGFATVLAPSVVPYLTATHTPLPTAAFAVPLSLVGAVLLVAIALSFHQYRHLKDERASDAEKTDISRRSSFSGLKSASTRRSDVKHAPDVLSSNDVGHGLIPASVFLPADVRREPRQSTRQAFPATYSVTASTHKAVVASTYPPLLRCLTRVTSQPISNVDADTVNASVTNLVLSNYVLPSPTLPSPLLPAPQGLHVRSEAAISPSFTTDSYLYRDKPLPTSPKQTLVGVNVYDVVAQAVSCQ